MLAEQASGHYGMKKIKNNTHDKNSPAFMALSTNPGFTIPQDVAL